jgi:hypothetical protein
LVQIIVASHVAYLQVRREAIALAKRAAQKS